MGKDDPIFVFSHIDADGISSAIIMLTLLKELDKPFILKFLPQILPATFDELWSELEPRYAIFLDLGTDLPNLKLEENPSVEGIIIDHHATIIAQTNSHLINPIIFDIDGSTEASSSSLTYLVASSFKLPDNTEALLTYLSTVGSLGDAQDVGPQRSLIGLNNIIATYAEQKKWIKSYVGLFMLGRSIKPLYRLLAEYSFFDIPGITGSYDGAHEFLEKNNIIPPKANINTIFLDNLSEDKRRILKKKLLEILLLKYSGQLDYAKLENMLSATLYKFSHRELPIGYYARDLAILFNASGKMKAPHIAVKAMLNPKSESNLQKLINMYDRYRTFISEALKKIEKKIQFEDKLVVCDGRDIIDEELTSTISSILVNKIDNEFQVLMVIAKSFNNILKISFRAKSNSNIEHLGELISNISKKIPNATGGGHRLAAGMYLEEQYLNDLIDAIKSVL